MEHHQHRQQSRQHPEDGLPGRVYSPVDDLQIARHRNGDGHPYEDGEQIESGPGIKEHLLMAQGRLPFIESLDRHIMQCAGSRHGQQEEHRPFKPMD